MISWLRILPRQAGQRLRDCMQGSAIIILPSLLFGLIATPANSQELTPEIASETFDQVWNQVRNEYFDYKRIATEWEQAREKLRPLALNADSQHELRNVLQDLLDQVGESHFNILPGESLEQIDKVGETTSHSTTPAVRSLAAATGVSLRLVDRRMLVSRTQGTISHGIQPGWELIEIEGKRIEPLIDNIEQIDKPLSRDRSEMMLEAAINSRLGFLAENESLNLTFVDATGQIHQTDIQGTTSEVETVRLGNLPPMPFQFRTQRIATADDCVGLIEFSTWVPDLMERFLAVRDALFECRGLIIDLRGNLGGVLTTMVPLAAHLVSDPVLLGRLTRSDGQLDFRVFPRRVANDGSRINPFDGPIAILIDSLSASTSEMFTSGMQAVGMARVFGQRSSGMALPAQMLPLANGDRLMYAFADYTDGQGRRIEGIGVRPDKLIRPDRLTLSAGQDPVIEAALNWIVSHPDSG